MSGHLGVQWAADLYGCDADALDDLDRIRAYMLEAAEAARATVISSQFHKFAPQGVSGVVVIAESHIAIHTWPERGYAALDVFTCGDNLGAEEAFRWLAQRFRATRLESARHVRGDPRRIERFHERTTYTPRHPELFRYDEDFVRRFLAVGPAQPVAEQIYQLPLFTPEFCRRIIEECEHHGGWVDDVEAGGDALSWEALPGLEAVYAEVITRHVRPTLASIWPTWTPQRWAPPVIHRRDPTRGPGPGLRHATEAVVMVGTLNDGFEGGGTGFPRWNLTVGDARSVPVGGVLVFPGGVSHAHITYPVTAGRCYTLVNSFS